MPKRRKISNSEYRMISNIGLSAGEVSSASLFATLFTGDRKIFPVGLFGLGLTFIFWGTSLLLARRFRI